MMVSLQRCTPCMSGGNADQTSWVLSAGGCSLRPVAPGLAAPSGVGVGDTGALPKKPHPPCAANTPLMTDCKAHEPCGDNDLMHSNTMG